MPPELTVMDDVTLYKKIRQGKESALGQLMAKYSQELAVYAFQITANKEEAEEVVGDMFVSLWKNRKKTAINHLRSYLYQGVRNKALNRKKEFRPTLALDEQTQFWQLSTDPTVSDPQKEKLEKILGIIAAMPPQRQRIFSLARINGLKQREIAKIMGLSEHTVRNHMVKAMAFLMEEIKRDKPTH